MEYEVKTNHLLNLNHALAFLQIPRPHNPFFALRIFS